MLNKRAATLQVQQLYVVQRTPAWILPRKNFVYWGWVKSMFARLPLLSRLYYSLLYWANEARFFIVFRSFWPLSAVPKLVSRYACADYVYRLSRTWEVFPLCVCVWGGASHGISPHFN
jgi:cation diffusion facilitator CzcD-associated flavoprotein CzcO